MLSFILSSSRFVTLIHSAYCWFPTMYFNDRNIYSLVPPSRIIPTENQTYQKLCGLLNCTDKHSVFDKTSVMWKVVNQIVELRLLIFYGDEFFLKEHLKNWSFCLLNCKLWRTSTLFTLLPSSDSSLRKGCLYIYIIYMYTYIVHTNLCSTLNALICRIDSQVQVDGSCPPSHHHEAGHGAGLFVSLSHFFFFFGSFLHLSVLCLDLLFPLFGLIIEVRILRNFL